MSNLGKDSGDKKEEISFEELKKSFDSTADKIRDLRIKNPDRAKITDELKASFRNLYVKAAQYAKSISERTTDAKEREDYKKYYTKLSEEATIYGSVMKGMMPKTKLEDVKGLDEVKGLIKSFIFMSKKEDLVEYYHLEGGLGMLMYGPPGTGKTMFAEAIANAMGLPLFIVTPADIFKSYVGESEQAVKQIFQEIDTCENGAILFVDECESIFSKRTQDTKDYKSAVTTELLQRMNGFGVNGAKRIMVAATNRPDQIDPAYLRYKRFSHIVKIPPPDVKAKEAIIKHKLKGIDLAEDIMYSDILAMTEKPQIRETEMGITEEITMYYSGADICGIIEEACRLALAKIEETNAVTPLPLTREMFEKAFEKIKPSISKSLVEMYDTFMEKNKA